MATVFYNADYVGSGHAFDTTRKAEWLADSLRRSPIPGIEIVSPSPLSTEQVERVHDATYVRAVRTGALVPSSRCCRRFQKVMDPFEACSTAGLTGITRQMLAAREHLVFDWYREPRVPVAFLLAGGCVGRALDEDGLVELHRLTLQAASESA